MFNNRSEVSSLNLIVNVDSKKYFNEQQFEGRRISENTCGIIAPGITHRI